MSVLHMEVVGDGPPLVLLHGFAMHGGLFAPIVPVLAERFRVCVPDLPGHGYSPPLAAATLDDFVAAVLERTRDLAAAPVFLGWSFGSMVALRLAHRFPERVGALILASATPRFVAGDDWPHAMSPLTLARFGDELTVAYRLTLQRFLTLQVQGSEAGRATLAALRRELFAREAPAPGALRTLLELLARTDLRDDARGVPAATLVITGARDTLTPAAAGAWLAGAMPNARHVDLPGAAHAPFLSHREAFLAAACDFLDARAELSRA